MPLLYLYRTTKHAKTSFSPDEILFSFNPPSLDFPTLGNISQKDPHSYSSKLQGKLLESRELVESNTVETKARQKLNYRGNNQIMRLQVGQEVLLDNPNKGNLNSQRVEGPLNVRTELKEFYI